MLASEHAWHEMGAAFEQAEGSLARRLMAALEAAEATGGDWRGRGGAALIVVPADGDPWERVIDLRVEEGDDSLRELRRLLQRAEAYRAANHARANRAETARAGGLPDHHVGLMSLLDAVERGDIAGARHLLGELEAHDPRWRDYARTLDAHPELPSLGAVLAE